MPSSSIQQYSAGLSMMSGRDARRVGRAIMRQEVNREIRQAEIAAETDVVIDKVQNISMVTATGMQAVTQIATMQASLEQLAPQVSGRLSVLADDHLFGVVELAQDARRRIRRI